METSWDQQNYLILIQIVFILHRPDEFETLDNKLSARSKSIDQVASASDGVSSLIRTELLEDMKEEISGVKVLSYLYYFLNKLFLTKHFLWFLDSSNID